VHQAAVRLPPADPSDKQFIVGPRTITWPVLIAPRAPPNRLTSASRAWTALAAGQG
jgi:hypothetical protein